MRVTITDLYERISEKTGIDVDVVKVIVEVSKAEILQVLLDDNEINLANFGTFYLYKKKGVYSRLTKETHDWVLPKFRFDPKFRQKLTKKARQ